MSISFLEPYAARGWPLIIAEIGANYGGMDVMQAMVRAAAACVNEFIARAYPFRHEPNQHYARTQFSLAACEEEYTAESSFQSAAYSSFLGRGSEEPLLGLPFLASDRHLNAA